MRCSGDPIALTHYFFIVGYIPGIIHALYVILKF